MTKTKITVANSSGEVRIEKKHGGRFQNFVMFYVFK